MADAGWGDTAAAAVAAPTTSPKDCVNQVRRLDIDTSTLSSSFEDCAMGKPEAPRDRIGADDVWNANACVDVAMAATRRAAEVVKERILDTRNS